MRWFFSWEFISLLPERLVFWIAFGFEQTLWRGAVKLVRGLRRANPIKRIDWDTSDSPKWIQAFSKKVKGFLFWIQWMCVVLFMLTIFIGMVVAFALLAFGLAWCFYAITEPLTLGPNVDQYRQILVCALIGLALVARLILAIVRVKEVWVLRHQTYMLVRMKENEQLLMCLDVIENTPEGTTELSRFPACPFQRWEQKLSLGRELGNMGWHLEITRDREVSMDQMRMQFWLVSDSGAREILGEGGISSNGLDLLEEIVRLRPHGDLVDLFTKQTEHADTEWGKEVDRASFLQSVIKELVAYLGPEFKTSQRDKRLHDELVLVLERFNRGETDPELHGLDRSRLIKIRRKPAAATG